MQFMAFVLYFVAAFSEFVAPYDPEGSFVKYKLAPPSGIHVIGPEGGLRWPFVYKIDRERDPEDQDRIDERSGRLRQP